MNAEFPGALRDLFKLTIEQCRRSFEMLVTTSEKTWEGIQASTPPGRGSMQPLMGKVVEITRANAEANFSLALKLADSMDTKQAMELYTEHARKQMEAFARQFEEVAELATTLIKNSNLSEVGNLSGAIVTAAPNSDDGNSHTSQKQNSMEELATQSERQTGDAPAVKAVTARASCQTTSPEDAQIILGSPRAESLDQPLPEHREPPGRKGHIRKDKKGKRHRNESK
jgi:hypothetical protein